MNSALSSAGAANRTIAQMTQSTTLVVTAVFQ
jgi:hypothetical protein